MWCHVVQRLWMYCCALLGLIVIHRAREASGHQVALDGGGYSFILSLSPELDQGSCTSYTTNIQLLLNATSHLLYEVSGRRLFFKQVTVVLPPGWECPGLNFSTTDEGSTWQEAALLMGPRHPIFGDTPWTQQTEGCGRGGEFIYLPEKFVQYLSEVLGPQEHVLLHEWAKYRWGVFEEYGHLYDPVYPPSFHSHVRVFEQPPRHPLVVPRDQMTSWYPNYCTDSPLIAQPGQFGSAEECVHEEDCVFLVNDKENENISSSLMSVPFLTKVRDFCDGSTHASDLPNKHNALCDGRSVWEVINQHSDLSTKPQEQEAPEELEMLFLQEADNCSFSVNYELDWTYISDSTGASRGDASTFIRSPKGRAPEAPKEETTATTPPTQVIADLQVWASHDLRSVEYDLDHPVVIFASVLVPDALIVLDAHVTATLKWAGGQKVLVLKDDGLTADVTGNDSVYSAFMFGPVGPTEVSVRATNEHRQAKVVVTQDEKSVPITYGNGPVCCGSRVVVSNTAAAPAFNASLRLSDVVFTNSPPAETLPGRIVDLVAKEMDTLVNLTFTMTGEHLDDGTAPKLKVQYWKYGQKTSAEQTTLLNDVPSGTMKSITLKPPMCSVLYVYTVLAITKENVEGPQSNRALAPVSCYTKPTTPKPEPPTTPKTLGVGPILGIVFGIIFFLILVGIGSYLIILKFYPRHLHIFGCFGCQKKPTLA